MNIKKILILLGILILLPFTLKIKAQSFGAGQSLFTDIKAHNVGDILTVNIVEVAKGSNQVETSIDKKTTSSTSGGPGLGTLNFFPMFGAEAKSNHKFDGSGENLREGELRARMSVTVVAVKSNGDLVIEGTRVIGISNDKETLTLTGIVRLRDISPDNTVESYKIADAEIHYTGKGAASTGSRPGFFTRILGWLF